MPTDEHADLLQAIELLSAKIDHLTGLLRDVVVMRRAGLPISEETVDRYEAELEGIAHSQQAMRETIARFWMLIGKTNAQ